MADIDDQGVKRMEDIARIVGVSKSTVSRALKNSSQISEKPKPKFARLPSNTTIDCLGLRGSGKKVTCRQLQLYYLQDQGGAVEFQSLLLWKW